MDMNTKEILYAETGEEYVRLVKPMAYTSGPLN
jgi:hypothetical protein